MMFDWLWNYIYYLAKYGVMNLGLGKRVQAFFVFRWDRGILNCSLGMLELYPNADIHLYLGIQSPENIEWYNSMLPRHASCWPKFWTEQQELGCLNRGIRRWPRKSQRVHGRNHSSTRSKLPSGKLTVCYWKLPFILDLPIKNCDFSIVM